MKHFTVDDILYWKRDGSILPRKNIGWEEQICFR